MTSFVLFGTSFGRSEDILFVGGGQADVNDDAEVVAHLESLGHTVSNLIGAESSTEDGEIHDLIVISSSLSSGTVRGKFQDLSVPVLFWEAGLTRWDHNNPDGNFRMSEYSRDGRGGETAFIKIAEAAVGHPLTAGLPAGEHQIFEDPFRTPVLYGEHAPGLIRIAELDPISVDFVDLRNQVDDPHEASVWVDEAGQTAMGPPFVLAALEQNGLLGPAGEGLGGAPARRVQFPIHDVGFASLNENGISLFDCAVEWLLGSDCLDEDAGPLLQPGDADQDLDFDQLDLIQVQVANKYLAGTPATWGEGDWDGAPGGEPGNPPSGNGVFDQLDIIAALGASIYLTGPYAALAPNGTLDDEQTTLIYDRVTGELSVDAPASTELTSIFVTSSSNAFVGNQPAVLDGPFDSFGADNIFKSTIGSSFGDITFGNVLPPGLDQQQLLSDLSASGSLAGGGGLGDVDLIYVPEPSNILLLCLGLVPLSLHRRRR